MLSQCGDLRLALRMWYVARLALLRGTCVWLCGTCVWYAVTCVWRCLCGMCVCTHRARSLTLPEGKEWHALCSPALPPESIEAECEGEVETEAEAADRQRHYRHGEATTKDATTCAQQLSIFD